MQASSPVKVPKSGSGHGACRDGHLSSLSRSGTQDWMSSKQKLGIMSWVSCIHLRFFLKGCDDHVIPKTWSAVLGCPDGEQVRRGRQWWCHRALGSPFSCHSSLRGGVVSLRVLHGMAQMSWDLRFQGALCGDRCPGILETGFRRTSLCSTLFFFF